MGRSGFKASDAKYVVTNETGVISSEYGSVMPLDVAKEIAVHSPEYRLCKLIEIGIHKPKHQRGYLLKMTWGYKDGGGRAIMDYLCQSQKECKEKIAEYQAKEISFPTGKHDDPFWFNWEIQRVIYVVE